MRGRLCESFESCKVEFDEPLEQAGQGISDLLNISGVGSFWVRVTHQYEDSVRPRCINDRSNLV